MAAGLYTVIVALSLYAAMAARRYSQPRAHYWIWGLIGLSFGAFALLRIVGAEELLRMMLRNQLSNDGIYDARRSFQRPLVIVLMVMFAALMLWGLVQQYRAAAHGRRNTALFIALAAVATILFVMGLRIVSLHQVDWVLYGPAKLNWFLDIGASLTVAAAAGYYVRLVWRRI
jgi:hypothetical protein